MEKEEKVREDRVRRILARQGYQLTKSNRRDPRAWDYGIYIATHIFANGTDSGVVARYLPTLDDAEEWALEGDRPDELADAARRPAKDWEDLGTVTVGANWLAQLSPTNGHSQQLKVLRGRDGRIRLVKVEPRSDQEMPDTGDMCG